MAHQSNYINPVPIPIIPPNADFFRSANGTLLPDGTTDFTDSISHNGGIGVAIATDPVLNALQVGKVFIRNLDPNGNFGGSGVTGSPSTTSGLVVTQTTPGIAITIANGATIGQRYTITSTHASTVPFTAYGFVINPGTHLELVWAGANWAPIAPFASGLRKFEQNGALATTQVITHNLGLLTPFGVVLQIRDNIDGSDVLSRITARTTNSITVVSLVAIASANIVVIG